MIILNEKQEPPPYGASDSPTNSIHSAPPPPFEYRRNAPKLDALPPKIILHIVNALFPTTTVDATVHRKTLYWLEMSLRLVSRGMYIACMHTLRSIYLPSYTQLIKPPYTSDPFPLVTPGSSTSPVLSPGNRETRALDLFIALKVREDVWMDETELHIEREECFKDLFDLVQPRSRTEDLVAQYGSELGLITFSNSPSRTRIPIRFERLSVIFSPRSLSLVLSSCVQKRTIVECYRERNEKLEIGARRLIKELERWSKSE